MLIYNTLTRQKEPLKTLKPKCINMYVCGVTVYDHCHLGHARCEVSFDVIRRYLISQGYQVTFVRNITDIDDKIIQRATVNQESCEALTARMIQSMQSDYASLGVLSPDLEPKATEYIETMKQLIQQLMDKGYAYATPKGDVYYRVRRFQSYGQLSGKIIDELVVGARVELNQDKEDPLDFALWKASKPQEPTWDAPWGSGRPGWHIECSAMCQSTLGETLDIHGGGPDLKFPHHENEIAQSEAITHKPLATVWMHVGTLRINENKMSKSLDNFLTIKDALAKHSAEAIRYFLISSHYRSDMNYSNEQLTEASVSLNRLYSALKGVQPEPDLASYGAVFEDHFHQAMSDDFNTPKAISVLFDLARQINRVKAQDTIQAAALSHVLLKLSNQLGLLYDNPEQYGQCGTSVSTDWIESMIEKRTLAKKKGDFKEADSIRTQLSEQGIELLDGRHGTTWKMSSS